MSIAFRRAYPFTLYANRHDTGEHDKISVQDFGIDNLTAADGLAVGTPSRFVENNGEVAQWNFTIDDNMLYKYLKLLADSENVL